MHSLHWCVPLHVNLILNQLGNGELQVNLLGPWRRNNVGSPGTELEFAL